MAFHSEKTIERGKEYDYLIVGAGVTGLTLAERLSGDGRSVMLIDKRNHIGGNCFDYKDKYGITVQRYGPHIFHTNEKKVMDYLKKFAEFNDYKHKVISYYRGNYYPMPINRETVNKFYGVKLKTEKDLKKFLEEKREKKQVIENSRDVVVSKFGNDLYEAFVKKYTKKQWGLYPEELDKTVLERLPIRYNDVPYYFDDVYQGMPIGGFGSLFNNMTKNSNMEIRMGIDFFKVKNKISYKNLIYTGCIDRYFEYKYGKLDYRCIRFELETMKRKSFQPNAVVNYTDDDVEFTRITEFKKFYFLKNEYTVLCREFPSWEGEPSYPVINKKNKEIYKKYEDEAGKFDRVYFAGRLGKYRYINIDRAVLEALNLYAKISAGYKR